MDFLTCQNNRQPFLTLRTDEVKRCPLFFERLDKEEFDAAKGDGYGGAFPLFDVFNVEEVVAEFFFSDLVRWFFEVLGWKSDGAKSALLSAFGKTAQRGLVQHDHRRDANPHYLLRLEIAMESRGFDFTFLGARPS